MVSPEKQAALEARLAAIGVEDDDLVEKFILGSGSGGQKINKTSSCVYLKHGPTGIEIKCQAHRSREMNRFLARQELCERLETLRRDKAAELRDQIEKYRRQNRQRSRGSKRRSVADKRKLSQKKSMRRSPGRDD